MICRHTQEEIYYIRGDVKLFAYYIAVIKLAYVTFLFYIFFAFVWITWYLFHKLLKLVLSGILVNSGAYRYRNNTTITSSVRTPRTLNGSFCCWLTHMVGPWTFLYWFPLCSIFAVVCASNYSVSRFLFLKNYSYKLSL